MPSHWENIRPQRVNGNDRFTLEPCATQLQTKHTHTHTYRFHSLCFCSMLLQSQQIWLQPFSVEEKRRKRTNTNTCISQRTLVHLKNALIFFFPSKVTFFGFLFFVLTTINILTCKKLCCSSVHSDIRVFTNNRISTVKQHKTQGNLKEIERHTALHWVRI